MIASWNLFEAFNALAIGAPPALFIKTSIDFVTTFISFMALSKDSMFLMSHSINTALLPFT